MGFSLKKSLGTIGKVAGAMIGASVGGPSGAAAGYSIGESAGNLFGANDSTREAKSLYKWQLGQETANNINLWNMQNEYNTPKNQMLRFKEAGLNPNLIYGQTNTASPISTASANLDLGNTPSQKTLGNYLALSNLGIQKDLSSAQVRNIDNSINMSRLNYGLARDKLNFDKEQFKFQKEIADAGWLGNIFGRSRGNKIFDWIFGPHGGEEVFDFSKVMK